MVQGIYEVTSSEELEEMATQYLEKTQPDKTLHNLVQWIPQCTRQSNIESMHLMIRRCAELEKEIEYVLSAM